MLIKDFYTIVSFEVSDQEIEAMVVLNPDHEVYLGHFPQQPVVPGVIQLQMIKELLEQQIENKLQLDTMSQAKFLGMIVPGQESLDISIKYKKTPDDFIHAEAAIKVNGQTVTKVKASYKLN